MSENRRLLVVDGQDYWRKLSAKALEDAGFIVSLWNSYENLPSYAWLKDRDLDLVILGCSTVGPTEIKFISHLLNAPKEINILVLCSSLKSGDDVRTLFLSGADNVAKKPYAGDHVVSRVNETLERIATRRQLII